LNHYASDREIPALNQAILESIVGGNWDSYARYCDPCLPNAGQGQNKSKAMRVPFILPSRENLKARDNQKVKTNQKPGMKQDSVSCRAC
jgi:hypothetical protein